MKWYFRVLKKYATFNGRARRKEYWMFVFSNIFVSLGIALLAGIIGLIVARIQFGDGRSASVMNMATVIGGLASIAYSLTVLIPSIAVAVRRMHDTGRSGWWIFFPLINFILLFVASQPAENKYGPNPKMAELSGNPAQMRTASVA
jgi:uncharacterized membrane protein YhaH (DUF805 family)